MKKYLVTAVGMTRETRRRAGKAWTSVVEVEDEARTPVQIEKDFETQQDLLSTGEIVKVIDVRELAEDVERRHASMKLQGFRPEGSSNDGHQ